MLSLKVSLLFGRMKTNFDLKNGYSWNDLFGVSLFLGGGFFCTILYLYNNKICPPYYAYKIQIRKFEILPCIRCIKNLQNTTK